MYRVIIDSVSLKELDNLYKATGHNVWGVLDFSAIHFAETFAERCRKIAPLADITVVAA